MKMPYAAAGLFYIFLLFVNLPAQADAWYKIRNRCSWFSKQYKTRAWVNGVALGGGLLAMKCNKSDSDCTLADDTNCFWEDKDRIPRAIALAGDRIKVPASDGAFSVWLENAGYARHIDDGFYATSSAGFNRILLPADQTTYFINRPKIVTNASTREGTIYHDGGAPIFNKQNHTITISGVVGELQVGASDVTNDFSALTISVTHEPSTYAESEDAYEEEQNYLNRLIWSSTAILNNGSVSMDGALTLSNFTVTKNDGQKNAVAVALRIEKIVISIPEDIDLDEVSVNFGVDGGNLGLGISQKFRVEQPTQKLTINPPYFPEEVFEFSNYPNPVSDQLGIRVELPYTYEIKIRLLDINGNKVKDIYHHYLPAHQLLEINESLKGVPTHRVYFLELETRDRILTRKVIVQ